ncbi:MULTISPECIES: hypothetical protein [Streptomyces]|uniref:Secreted protein n=1 Tax=Streptomyces flaveolus TaxID=67297 RepID=A0ABV3A668_9ACTN|nr:MULTISPECIES: hypothetical protein [Streptomyces]KMS88455.1 hypothetical protein ACZ91_25235 [Streptomyces regensis]KOG64617.1 hypothetical protein ADK77_20625 [Streptomyces antibioticus]KOV84838.1 hypothetical protein ADL02_20235 [Streptomyces sp. NRRL WC-3723]MBG7700864.1 hypothetical protein [Streptomyces sp. MC1]
MPEHAPTLQLIGVAVLAVAAVVWAVVLLRLMRRAGRRTVVRRSTAPLPALPSQTRVGPSRESVELTPAEQDAFAGLVRHLANG